MTGTNIKPIRDENLSCLLLILTSFNNKASSESAVPHYLVSDEVYDVVQGEGGGAVPAGDQVRGPLQGLPLS